MNTAPFAKYAPEARRDFIAAVTAEAVKLGITEGGIADHSVEGDVLLVEGRAFPRAVAASRAALVERVEAQGFAATMDAVAYTWFNRLVAIRYMEVHGYLDHGYRVLSHPSGGQLPEILSHAAEVELPGLDREKVVELKLDGTRDEELYQMLLKAQCNALHQAMPFLFDEVGGASEVLLPGNLLQTDSLIRQMVEGLEEGLWQDIEIFGWLYQFYISEKKDQVIGKVVKSEDIPAATQLFTPNWIVKYMVQNSLGAQWLATYPQSPLKGQMEYYIEPAEQTDEVTAQLAAITPSQLNPEELTLIDPASGSGHILVEAYELFKAIYLERGYRQRDVPQLILEKNLFGLDIDERAAQLTGFALMMKGRADDRRLFERGMKLNVLALVDSAGFDAEGLAKGVELSDYGLKPGDLTELKRLFEYATTFGSLIQVPEGLASSLPALKQLSDATSQDLFVSEALKRLAPLVQQAELLAVRYDAVVANPPYMGGRFMNPQVKRFAELIYPDSKTDTFACFIERGNSMARGEGLAAMVTMESWMFLSSFEAMRTRLLADRSVRTLVQLEAGIVCGFGTAAAVIGPPVSSSYKGKYSEVSESDLGRDSIPRDLQGFRSAFRAVSQAQFDAIPGSPLAHWASEGTRRAFQEGVPFGATVPVCVGLQTGDNSRFLRYWAEVSLSEFGRNVPENSGDARASGRKWFAYNKGGGFRKWFGNGEFVVNWQDDGREIREFGTEDGGRPRSRVQNTDYFFKSSVTWSFIGESLAARYSDSGAIFDVGGSSAFPTDDDRAWTTGLLCSKLAFVLAKVLNPTLNFQVGNIAAIPLLQSGIRKHQAQIGACCASLINLGRSDWDSFEPSWDFQSLPILTTSPDSTPTLESCYAAWITQNRDTIAEMKRLEEENNRLFIDAYGLSDELTPDVPIEQITLTVNPAYRYGGKLTEAEQWTRFRQDTMEELVSYAIGCMMGRYSLDAPGLIYAHSGNEGFDPSQYTTFPADDDGIVPLTDTEWFEDDACNRFVEFISKAWPAEHLEANLTFLAENISPKKNESSRDTLRRYLTDKFFKDHVQRYKKRPIYWLFSSGKQKAFQAIVYLHRYNEGTMARMRAEYVIPLQGKLADRLERLEGDIKAATSSAQTKRLEKERTTLQKQQTELQAFDEKLRHYADMRISIDLDDGVKVNYGKFGDLLAEVRAVHGKIAQEA